MATTNTNTEVSICSLALSYLGEGPLIALDNSTTEGQIALLHYPRERNALLALHPWNFAIKRITLSESASAPNHQYDNAFQIPSDCLRVLEMLDEDYYEWEVENIGNVKFIVTDATTCKIKYISTITNTALFSESFTQLLSMRLAVSMCMPITRSKTLMDSLRQMYEDAEMDAFNTNSWENCETIHNPDDLIDVRS